MAGPIEEQEQSQRDATLLHETEKAQINKAAEGLDYLSVGPDIREDRRVDSIYQDLMVNRDLGNNKLVAPEDYMDWTQRVVEPKDLQYENLRRMPQIRSQAGRETDYRTPDEMNARRYNGIYSGPMQHFAPQDVAGIAQNSPGRHAVGGLEDAAQVGFDSTLSGVIDEMQQGDFALNRDRESTNVYYAKPWTVSEWAKAPLDNGNWWDNTPMPGLEVSPVQTYDQKMVSAGPGRFANENIAGLGGSEQAKTTQGEEPQSLWDRVKGGIAESARTGILSHIGGEGPGTVDAVKDLYNAIEKSVQSGGEDVESVFDAAAQITALGVARGIVRGNVPATKGEVSLSATGAGGDSIPPFTPGGARKLPLEDMADRFGRGGANDSQNTIPLTPYDRFNVARVLQSGTLPEVDNMLYEIKIMKTANPKESFIHKTADEWEKQLLARERRLVESGAPREQPEPKFAKTITEGSQEAKDITNRISELSDKITTFGENDQHIAGVAEMQREMLLSQLPPEAKANALQDMMVYAELRMDSEFPNTSRSQMSLFDQRTFDKLIDLSNWANDKYEKLPESLRAKIEANDRPEGISQAAADQARAKMRENVIEGGGTPAQRSFNFRQPLRTAEQIAAENARLEEHINKIDPEATMQRKELDAQLHEKFPEAGPGQVDNAIRRVREQAAANTPEAGLTDLLSKRDQVMQDLQEARSQGRKMAADRLRQQLKKVNKDLEKAGVKQPEKLAPGKQLELLTEEAKAAVEKPVPEESIGESLFQSPEDIKYRISRLEDRLDDPYLSGKERKQVKGRIKALTNQLGEVPLRRDPKAQQEQLTKLEAKLANAKEKGRGQSHINDIERDIRKLESEMEPKDLGAARTPEALIHYDEPYRPTSRETNSWEPDNPNYRNPASHTAGYEIVDKHTGKVVGTVQTLKRAITSVNKRDNKYGGYRYMHRKIEPKDLGAARTPPELINYDEPYRPNLRLAAEGGGPDNNFGMDMKGLGHNLVAQVALHNVASRFKLLKEAYALQKREPSDKHQNVVRHFQARFERERNAAQNAINALAEDVQNYQIDNPNQAAVDAQWEKMAKRSHLSTVQGGAKIRGQSKADLKVIK